MLNQEAPAMLNQDGLKSHFGGLPRKEQGAFYSKKRQMYFSNS